MARTLRDSLRIVLYGLTWALTRSLFRFSCQGREHLPGEAPFILVANHASPLDAWVLAAALPWRLAKRVHWAGKRSVVHRSGWRRAFCWVAQVVPVDQDASAVERGRQILQQGEALAWFPEGTRTRDGRLQAFKPGIALLLSQADAPAVPVRIEGTFEAYPPTARLPRLGGPISVRFGTPVSAEQLGLTAEPTTSFERVAETLRQQVADLSTQ